VTTSEQTRTQTLFRKLKRLPKKISAKPDAHNVHELRTTIRRVETLLEVTSNGTGRKERKLKKQMDRVRRRAGKVRDLDVQIAALENIKVDSIREERQRVLQYLRGARAKRENKLIRALEEEMDGGLEKHLGRTAERVSENGAGQEISAVKPDPEAVVARARETFRDAVERHGALTEQNLHAFRLACKRVRYVAEMAGQNAEAKRIMTAVKRVQDAIGEWHDWVTLGATASKVLGTGSSPLLSVIATNTRSKFLHALRVADQAKRDLLPEPGAEEYASRAKKPVAGQRGVSRSAATA